LETKPRPAYVQAEKIKIIAQEKKLFKKEFLTAKYIITYYEALFPWLREYVGFNSEELLRSVYATSPAEEEDPVSFYISAAEFKRLPVSERNQKALDRYWNRDKDPWQIGRDYERYIGYLYEGKGFKVQYHGIEKGKEDLGRDLVCTKGGEVEIVQCKYWAQQKGSLVRENHITQLYGTTIKYFLDALGHRSHSQTYFFPEFIRERGIRPVLVTTTDLSETAREFAAILGIRVDKISMDKTYPCIKCNINAQTGERIYHLPFDQQYDKAVIVLNTEECWVGTVLEAEKLGFRRAWRWKGAAN
jgi:Restriction endonuclease